MFIKFKYLNFQINSKILNSPSHYFYLVIQLSIIINYSH